VVFVKGPRVDLLVQVRVVVVLESLESLAQVRDAQLLSCRRLLSLSVGLLINYGAATLKEGLNRTVENLQPSESPRLRVNQRGLTDLP
jgi:GxxExxY protein